MTLDDVAAMATALPEVGEGTSYGNRAWKVRDKTFVWERPLRKGDVEHFGDGRVPGGDIVGLRCADLEDKAALLASGIAGVFTTPHFDGHASILVELDGASPDDVRELVVDAWLTMAPRKLRDEFLADGT